MHTIADLRLRDVTVSVESDDEGGCYLMHCYDDGGDEPGPLDVLHIPAELIADVARAMLVGAGWRVSNDYSVRDCGAEVSSRQFLAREIRLDAHLSRGYVSSGRNPAERPCLAAFLLAQETITQRSRSVVREQGAAR